VNVYVFTHFTFYIFTLLGFQTIFVKKLISYRGTALMLKMTEKCNSLAKYLDNSTKGRIFAA